MERRWHDREREERDRDRWVRHGRIRYDRHDHERERHRAQDDRTYGGREHEGGYHRFDRYVAPEEDIPMHGRYRYGPEEDRGQRSGDDRHHAGAMGRRERPQDEPHGGPGRRDDYAMYREGNDAGYDTWHGHNHYQNHNDPSAMGAASRSSWQRRAPEEDERDWGGDRPERWRSQRYGDYERGDGERFARGRSERDWERGSGRDNAAMWRRFDEWGDTTYGARRDSGLGFRRAPRGGGRFWESPGADREDE